MFLLTKKKYLWAVHSVLFSVLSDYHIYIELNIT